MKTEFPGDETTRSVDRTGLITGKICATHVSRGFKESMGKRGDLQLTRRKVDIPVKRREALGLQDERERGLLRM